MTGGMSKSSQVAQRRLKVITASPAIRLRAATPEDLPLLQRWDEQPHLLDADPNDDWRGETELHRSPDWRE